MKIYYYIFIYIYLLTAIGLPSGGSGYFTCKQNMKLVTTRFKLGGLHEKHVENYTVRSIIIFLVT